MLYTKLVTLFSVMAASIVRGSGRRLDQPAFNRKRLKAEKLIDSEVLEQLLRVQVDAGCSRQDEPDEFFQGDLVSRDDSRLPCDCLPGNGAFFSEPWSQRNYEMHSPSRRQCSYGDFMFPCKGIIYE